MSILRDMFVENWPMIIIVLVVGCIVYLISMSIIYDFTHPCIKFHQEVQYEAPPGIVVGGGKYGGGVSIPVGNIKPKNVEVCDQR